MVPTKDDKPADPRSLMTDREKFLPRSLHTPKTLAIFAAYVAKMEKVSKPEAALKKVLAMCDLDGNYSKDPTYAKCVENTGERMRQE
jgi:hypothetical protein